MTSDELRSLIAGLRSDAETMTGREGLGVAERIEQAADALEATLPDEREGRCWCPEGPFEWRSDLQDGAWRSQRSSRWPYGPDGQYCPHCGAHLGADGIARRNADTDRAALDGPEDAAQDGCEKQMHPAPETATETCECGYTHDGCNGCKHNVSHFAVGVCADCGMRTIGQCYYITDSKRAGHELEQRDAAYAALECLAPLQTAAAQDGEPQGIAAIIGKWPGDETDKEIKEALEAMRPPHPDTQRMDALERMVAESAKRGEAVEIDGRSPGLVLLSRWWPGGALEHVSSRPTLRLSIDAARGQPVGRRRVA